MKKIIIIDNYDSFTYTINSYFIYLGMSTEVIKNDDNRLMNIECFDPKSIVISPGPGHPEASGYTLEVIKKYFTSYPFLGICLGHQCLINAFGGETIPAEEIMHGKVSLLSHNHKGLFENIDRKINITRYHSLIVNPKTLPKDFLVTGWTYDTKDQKVIMAVQHKHYPLFGVQFHPEAILTEHGYTIFKNFLAWI